MTSEQKIISFMQFQMPAIAWSFFIYIASSIPMSRLPSLQNYSDKFVHAGVFSIFCWLFHVALHHQPNKTLRRYSLLIAVFITSMYGITDEYHQLFTPGRSTDVFDFIADTVGGLIYAAVYFRYKFYTNE